MEPTEEIESQAQELFQKTRRNASKAGQQLIKRAYNFALDSHHDQHRKTGEAFIIHPLSVAEIVADLELDPVTIASALLHDVVEDTTRSLEEIRSEFGDEIARIIDGVTKLGRLDFTSREEQQAENMRKLFISMAKDVRVILIKLADRIHNLETIEVLAPEKMKEKAQETIDIYAPLAHRFGIYQLKWRLEDLAFEVLYPKRYREITKMVAERRGEREKYTERVEKLVGDRLKKNKIKAEVKGRVKHFYSIYEKMVNRGVQFDDIYDLIALRVLVDSVKDCYGALGIIHAMWKPVPGHFKDYIAMPKMNMYSALHTGVMGPEGRPLEIQIRTQDMHRTAEYGIAAHWIYKETVKKEQRGKVWLKRVLEWQSEMKDPEEYMRTLRLDLFQEEVFVFTPKGDVISVPRGSNPIDFAYAIHTEVGHHCVGSKVNGKMVPLEYQLQNGDIVDIITSKTSSGPSRDWLNIVETPRARSKIKHWFSQERREDEMSEGREVLTKALRKRGMAIRRSEVSRILAQVAEDYHLTSLDRLYRDIATGHISPVQVASKVSHYLGEEKGKVLVPEAEVERPTPGAEVEEARLGRMIKVEGLENALVKLAHCCRPTPGDGIMGFVTRGRGVSVHRRDCPNVQHLSQEADRLIKVEWGGRPEALGLVELCVEAIDRPKLIRDISTVLGDQHINILSASFTTTADRQARCNFIFEIGSDVHLEEIKKSIRKVDWVYDVYEVEVSD